MATNTQNKTLVVIAALIAIIVPTATVVRSVENIRRDIKELRQDFRRGTADPWAGTHQRVWSERLQHDNEGKIVVPDPDKVLSDVSILGIR